MRWNAILLVVLAIAVGGGVSELQAATILVPGDYSTVLAAVDAAVAGDSVLVGPGTWSDIDTRTVVIGGIPRLITGCGFPRGGVSIIGSGVDVTVLDPSPEDTGAGLLITIAALEVAGEGAVVIEGLTLARARRPDGTAGALAVSNPGGLIARSCRFTENGTEDLSVVSVGAVVDAEGASVQFIDCLVDRNICFGGAMWVNELDLTIIGCRFEENLGPMIRYDNTYAPGHRVRIENSEFIRNRSENGLVCIDLAVSTDFLISGCRFVENVAETREAASIRVNGSNGDIEFCVFERDSCLATSGRGAGIRWEQSLGRVSNCTFVGCYSRGDGTGFSGAFGGGVEFSQNLVTHAAGAASVNVSGTELLSGTGCNIFWANGAGDYGNWSVTTNDAVIDPSYCDFELGDYTVREGSACLSGLCAPVGAFGMGCPDLSVKALSWARIKALYRPENGGTTGPE